MSQERQRKGPPVRRPKRYTTEAAKSALVDWIREGKTIASGLEHIDYAQKTYEMWRKNDPVFKQNIDTARQLRDRPKGVQRGERMGFAEWRRKYLNTETPWHQLQWVDLLENRPPRDLHDGQTFEQRRLNRILVNCPPNHGKSICLTVDYTVFRLCMDPSFRVLLISAGQDLAADFLFGIKQRLTSPDFIDMQLAYAPDGGWESTSESWTDKRIVFGSDVRAQGKSKFHEKDANVLALGMRSKVYGRRADLIIVDDGVDTTNVSEHAKQMKWLRQMVETRLEQGGKLLVIGTRVASVDLYSELLNGENYSNGQTPWTYLASPAILHEAENPEDSVTLWPRQQEPWVHPEDRDSGDLCDCGRPECSDGFDYDGQRMYARWDMTHLEIMRASFSATDWALVYQQSGVSENSTFPEYAIQKATNSMRLCGRLESDRAGHPYKGMHGMYIIAGLDPAVKGFAGIVVGAVDKETQKRYILAAINMKAPGADELKNKMYELTEFYGIHEWRVETTGLLKFFTQAAELRQWFQRRGVKFKEHETGRNKWDAGFGVSSMASLFGEYDRAYDDPSKWRTITEPLIELPRPNQEGMKALVHQLIIWTPELDPAKVPCDLVMALWFFNTGAREHLGIGRSGNVIPFGRDNKFVSPMRQKNRQRVNLADYRQNSH